MKYKYIPVIGMEVHIELSTESKMFCECPAFHFGVKPNTQVCPVCLGLPGALPYPNKKAIEDTIKFGSVFGCKINSISKFDRKHYFYPDLPKSYQISQYDLPFCHDGKYLLPDTNEKIGITRIHLEEDTGKLIHKKIGGTKYSFVDFNRSGVPLLELVTEPDFRDLIDVSSFLKEIQLIARYLGISAADMEKGSMRLEANISVAKVENNSLKELPKYKVELKNINSFKFLEKALKAEIQRQKEMLEMGEKIIQETRGYNESSGNTFSQRTKEEEKDYRYFPEPDIPPIEVSKKEIDEIILSKGLLHSDFRKILRDEYSLPLNYVEYLIGKKSRVEYFINSVKKGKKFSISPKTLADLIVNNKFDEKYEDTSKLIQAVQNLQKKVYSGTKEVDKAALRVIKDNKKAVEDFKKGKTEVVGFLIGMVQKILKGKGNPKDIQKSLLSRLQK